MPQQTANNYLAVLVALLTITGTAIPFVVTTLYNQLFNKPALDIQGYFVHSKAIFHLVNDGITPATNISIKITSDSKIINLTNLDNFEKFKIVFPNNTNSFLNIHETRMINDNLLIVFIPKLVNGKGSTFSMLTSFATDNDKSDLSSEQVEALVRYDQGSILKRDLLNSGSEGNYIERIVKITHSLSFFYSSNSCC